MDLVRTELLPPVRIAELHREARHNALADLAAGEARPGPALAIHIGSLLVKAGCRLETAGRRHVSATQLATPLACHGGQQPRPATVA